MVRGNMAGRRIEIRMLGRFEVSIDGRPIPETSWRRRRAADLVKLLALAPHHRLTREQVMESFWPDLEPNSAAANLRKAGFHARQALGLPEGVVHVGEVVVLGRGLDIVTDADEFVRVAQSALVNGDRVASRHATTLYSGELLPDDRYASWCSRERDLLANLYLRVLERGELWGRIVEVEPTHERAHQKIIAGYLEKRDRVAALRQFEELRVALRDELGVVPDGVSTGLYEDALALDAPDTPTPAERARALLAWGVVHWERHDIEEAKRTATAARALAIDAGLGRELAEASELLGLIAYAQGRWREVFGREFIESIRKTPTMAEFLFDAHMCMSEFALSEVDGLREVGNLAETILAASRDVESEQGAALGLLLRGEVALLGGGDPSLALEYLNEAARLHAGATSLTGETLALARIAQTEAVAGDKSSAVRRFRTALELAQDSAVKKHLLPFVYGGLLGVLDEGSALLAVDEAEEAIADLDICDPCSMPFRVGAIHACVASGEMQRAKSYLADAERVSRMWSAGPWHAAIAEARAAIAASDGGDTGTIVRLLYEAATGYETSSRPREALRCRQAAESLA